MNNYRLNRNFMDDDRLESIDMPYYGYGGSEIFARWKTGEMWLRRYGLFMRYLA